MNEIEIVKDVMKRTNTSHAVLAKAMGMATPSGVSNRLLGRSMTVEVLIEMLDALSCELIIKQTNHDKKTYVVRNENRKEGKRETKKQRGEG